MNRAPHVITLLVIACSLSSCGLFRPRRDPLPQAPQEESTDRLVGTVGMVNPDSHFVLIALANRHMALTSGMKVRCFDPTTNAETAQLTVGYERKGAHQIADIHSGEPKLRDLVAVQITDVPKLKPNGAAAAATGPVDPVTGVRLINGLPDPAAMTTGAKLEPAP